MSNERAIRFARYVLDPETGQLMKDGQPIKLHPQPTSVLALLAGRAGEIVTRDEIRNKLWDDDTHVDFELGINSCIRQIRAALGDDADSPRFVATVPRKGYRFIASVEESSQERRPSRSGSWVILGMFALGLAGATVLYLSPARTPSRPLRTTPLTSLDGSEWDPAFSPDGNQMAFAWDGGGNGSFNIYIKMVGGSDTVQLTDAPSDDRYPTWSPDGRQIAFSRQVEGGYEVRTVPALGGSERRLATSLCFSFYLDWSDDGRFIAMMNQDSPDEPPEIALLSTETGEKTNLTSPPHTVESDRHPRFSPDGQTIAFIRWGLGDTTSEIYLQPVRGGEPRLLSLDVDWTIYLDWLPDSSALIAVCQHEGSNGLWEVPVNGSQARKLPLGEDIRSISLDGTGTRLAYVKLDVPNADIWRVGGPRATEPAEPEKLFASTRFDWAPEFSPDGSKIAFTSTRSGSNAVWLCDSDGSSCEQFTQGGRESVPSWSPDGEKIAYTGHRDGRSHIYVADSEGAFHRQLTDDETGGGAPAWSRDGKWIYFTSDRSGESQTWKIPAEGGEPIQITTNGGRAAKESEDGRFLYYLKQARTWRLVDIYRTPVEGGDEELVLKGKTGALNWQLWEGDLIFANPVQTSGVFIQRMDLETGVITSLVELDIAAEIDNGLAVSPDGRWILYTQAVPHPTDIVMAENFR